MSRDYETYELAQRGDRAQLPAAGETGYGGGFDYVKHRAVRVLTRLPELFYALGRHWFLILVCVGLAGVASWYVVLSLPLVYEGRAQIVSKVRDTEEEEGPQNVSRGAFLAHVYEQTQLLQSWDVIRAVVKECGLADEVLLTPEEAPTNSVLDRVRQKIQIWKAEMSQTLNLEDPELQGQDEDKRVEQAILRFRDRSEVEHEKDTEYFNLILYGKDRARLLKELHSWIDSFKTKAQDLVRQENKNYYKDRHDHYARLEREAKEKLDEFKAVHENVSEALYEEWGKKIEEHRETLRQISTELFRLITTPPPRSQMIVPGATNNVPDVAETDKQELMNFNARLIDAEAERQRLIAAGYKERSARMKQQVAQIASLEKTVLEIQERIWQKQREQNTAGLAEEMKRLQEEADATFLEDWEKRQGEQEVKLRDAQTLAEAEMKRLFDVRGGMEDDLAQLRDLTAKYEEYKTERESKARQMEEQDNKVVDIAAARVQVSDSPYVSQQPYNYHPFLYMAAGCGGGLFVGILLALALEIFSRKVRFKHDIIADYGLPVVGVVPRRNY